MKEDEVHSLFITEVKEFNELLAVPSISIHDFLTYSDEVMESCFSRTRSFLPQKTSQICTSPLSGQPVPGVNYTGILSWTSQEGRDALYHDTDLCHLCQ